MYISVHHSFSSNPSGWRSSRPRTIPIQAKINVIPAILTGSGTGLHLEIDSFITGPVLREAPQLPRILGDEEWVKRPNPFQHRPRQKWSLSIHLGLESFCFWVVMPHGIFVAQLDLEWFKGRLCNFLYLNIRESQGRCSSLLARHTISAS